MKPLLFLLCFSLGSTALLAESALLRFPPTRPGSTAAAGFAVASVTRTHPNKTSVKSVAKKHPKKKKHAKKKPAKK